MSLLTFRWVLSILLLNSTLVYAQTSSHSTISGIRYSAEQPLRYRIADIDTRLNIDKQEVIELAQQATEIWANGTGQNFFVYDPNASFEINLVFDQRQARSMQRSKSLRLLEDAQQKRQLQNKKILEIQEKLNEYNTQIQLQTILYQGAIKDSQAEIKRSNSWFTKKSDFIDQSKYQQIIENKRELLDELIAKRDQANVQLQKQKEQFNQVDLRLAESVAEFNQIFQPRTLHKGQFTGKQILIYEFSSSDDLRLTLAHEFGHALGLKHTDNPKSLMYPRIREQDAKHLHLTDTDLSLLGLTK